MSMFYYSKSRGSFWFRLFNPFGIGLSIEDRSIRPALFSERNGYRKVLRIGKWSIRLLHKI